MTLDELISELQSIRKDSRLGGETCVYVACLGDDEYKEVRGVRLEQDNDGSLVVVGLMEDDE